MDATADVKRPPKAVHKRAGSRRRRIGAMLVASHPNGFHLYELVRRQGKYVSFRFWLLDPRGRLWRLSYYNAGLAQSRTRHRLHRQHPEIFDWVRGALSPYSRAATVPP